LNQGHCAHDWPDFPGDDSQQFDPTAPEMIGFGVVILCDPATVIKWSRRRHGFII
jgi:hypothetical protein